MSWYDKAVEYCEEKGLLEFRVEGCKVIYYTNYPAYLTEPRRTYKVTYNLKTKEEERVLLQRWNSKGNYNLRR